MTGLGVEMTNAKGHESDTGLAVARASMAL